MKCLRTLCLCTVAILALKRLSAGIISGRWGYCPVCRCNILLRGADKLPLMCSLTCSPPCALKNSLGSIKQAQTVAGLLPLNTERCKQCLIISVFSSFKADNKLTKVSDHKHELRVCTFLWESFYIL